MKIQILSDLHLEFIRDMDELDQFLEMIVPVNESDRDVLVIAGDLGIHAGSKVEMGAVVSALTFFSQQYNLVLYVLGNHEFYHSSFQETLVVFSKIEQMVNSFFNQTRLLIMHRHGLNYRDKHFFGCTLWFNERPENYFLQDRINDFRFIDNSLDDFHVEGASDFAAIESGFNDGHDDIIITHHLPSMRSVGSMYKGSRTNAFYVHDHVERLISHGPDKPRLWIHGHTHSSNDYMLGNVRVICNPGGYPQKMENPDFNPRLIVEV